MRRTNLVPLGPSHPRYEALDLLLKNGLAHAREKTDAMNIVRGLSVVERRADVFSKARTLHGPLLSRLGHSSADQLRLAIGGGSRGAARRGAVFALTPDARFLIKEESGKAVEALCQHAEAYWSASTGSSLLPRYVGVYDVTVPKGATTHWVVMHNVLYAPLGVACRTVYDLKGSRTGRQAKRPDATQKDLDAIEHAHTIQARCPKRLRRRLEVDTRFLEERGFLDYSLLVGVFEPKLPLVSRVLRRPISFLRRRGRRNRGVTAVFPKRGNHLLVVGIIDVLQQWDISKRCEFLFRGALFGYRDISAVPPAFYRSRLLAFVDSLFFRHLPVPKD